MSKVAWAAPSPFSEQNTKEEEMSLGDLLFPSFEDRTNWENDCIFCKKFANCHTDGHRCAAYEPRGAM